MKKIVSLVLCLVLIVGLAACGSPKEEPIDLSGVKCNVYALNGPTGMGLVPLMKDAKEGKGTLDYNIQTVAANDEIVAKVVKGEADIAAVATNMASTLYSKTNGGIKVLAVNTLGTLSVVTKGEEITKIEDLKGKTVYTTGQGANPEYIINYILDKNGLKVGEDVTLNFVSQPAELVQTVAQNEKVIVIAPQPVATTITVKDSAAKVVIDLNDEWEAVSDTKLVMGCIIVRNEYLENNKEAVEAFLSDYKKSIEVVNKADDEVAKLCAEYGIVAAAPIAKKAIPFCNIVCETGSDMKNNLSSYLDFLYEANPKSVGGAVPTNDFYYEK